MKITKSILVAICVSLLIPITTLAQENDARGDIPYGEVVNKLDALLRKYYVFEDVGNQLADLVSANLASGIYAGFPDPVEFANALTRDIQSTKDKHMVVVYSPKTANALLNPVETVRDEAEYARYKAERAERSRMSNYGFHKLEILDGNIGYLDLRSFDSHEKAIPATEAAMGFLSNSDAIIIDLRRNTGGGDTIIASYFFGEQPVHMISVYFRQEDRTLNFYTREKVEGKRMPDVDLYILTGTDTFSAAEAFAYSFKHLGRATIIGTVTQGGAHMTKRMPINSEYYATISVAAGLNEITKTNWEGVGVQPHIVTSDEEALEVAHKEALKKLIKASSDPDKIDDYKYYLEKMK